MMMRNLMVSLLVWGWMGFAVAAAVRLNGENEQYVEMEKDRPLFLVGYHAHNLDLGNSIGYEWLLELNARNRVNYMRYFPFSGRMLDTKGDRKWMMYRRVGEMKVDLGEWEPGRWERVREHLAFMEKNGIIAHISLFEGCLKWKEHPYNERFNVNEALGNVDRDGDGNGYEQGEYFDYEALVNPDVSAERKALKHYQELHIGKLLEETAGFSNVMYEIGNELPNPGEKWVQYWVAFVRERCDRLVTYNGNMGLDEMFDGATDHVQKESRVRQPFRGAFKQAKKFIGSSSDGGVITNIGAYGGRRCLWKAFTGEIGGWLNYSSDFYVVDAEFYYYSAESPGAYNLRKGLYYANAVGFIQDWGLAFQSMRRRDDAVLKAPKGVEAYCLAGTGEMVVYLAGERIAGQLEVMLDGGCEYGYWYNPRTGEFFEHVEVKAGRNVLEIPASKQDVVFYAGKKRLIVEDVRVTDAAAGKSGVEFSLRHVGKRLDTGDVRGWYSTDGLETFEPCKKVVLKRRGDVYEATIEDIAFGHAAATRNWVRIGVQREDGLWVTGTFCIKGMERAWVALGKDGQADGLRHVQCADGQTVADKKAGKGCLRNKETGGRTADKYVYFAVNDEFAYAEMEKRFEVRVTYLDVADGMLELQYDGRNNAYVSAGKAEFEGTGMWKTHVFKIEDGYFGSRQNNGADFRLYLGEGKVGYIQRVEVEEKEFSP